MPPTDTNKASSPIQGKDTAETPLGPQRGMALCLSGGGYRAMLFHVGALWRLYELGLLKTIKRISSVSGGSITAALLGLRWSTLTFNQAKLRQEFVPQIVKPIRALADRTIDTTSIVCGLLSPWATVGDNLAAAYRTHLYGDATLQDLPNDPPRFVINATNIQSAALWRFMKPYMRDWRVGEYPKPHVPLAVAVAASSAFPPVLSPVTLTLDDGAFTPGSGKDLQRPPYTTRVVLSDGGVYDNLGLETAWKRYDTILVSDAGGKTEAEEQPSHDWARHSVRVLDVIDNQVRSLRKRQLIASYIDKTRKGTYWGIRSNVANYELPGALPCSFERTTALARIDTRLRRLDKQTQEELINWGYAVCDTACRKHLELVDVPAPEWPYPRRSLK